MAGEGSDLTSTAPLYYMTLFKAQPVSWRFGSWEKGGKEEGGEESILHLHAENSMNEGVDAERKLLYLLQICHAAARMWFLVTHTVEV